MDLFDLLTLIGGLSLFLFGMNLMGQALERRAGGRLRSLLGKLTTGRTTGLLTGLVITAVIQSSSATTVMVVGFVNSGLMTLRQAIHVIMGANIGTTVTAWLLSLAGIDSGSLFLKLLKPSSFTPVFAFVGIILYLFCKSGRRKDTGMIFLGFATLMFGMETMSGAVSGLRNAAGFRNLFLAFQNPILGVLAGAILTAVIQSSSASVGILQALAVSGQVSYNAAIPIIMGQNIGTCVTAVLSAVGAGQNAKRAAMVHLSFNVIGAAVWLTVFCGVKAALQPAWLDEPASLLGIAVAHTIFNVLCTLLMLPLPDFLEKLVGRLVPDGQRPDTPVELDERLLLTPPIALEQCREVAADMARTAVAALREGIAALRDDSPELAASVREKEETTDRYEDRLGAYLVRLSACPISEADSAEAAQLLKLIGDFERISDHAVNLLESAEEMQTKSLHFSAAASAELSVIFSAVEEILDLSLASFLNHDRMTARLVEPLEQVIDRLKEELRTRHILRLQQGSCSIDVGFVWSDLLTDLERAADHCSNIAACVMDLPPHAVGLCTVRESDADFKEKFQAYTAKYSLPTA
jgi:phosphate:Na+ symporter